MVFEPKVYKYGTQLLECCADWNVAMNTHHDNVDIVYLDFSKAFDSVVHSKLIAISYLVMALTVFYYPGFAVFSQTVFSMLKYINLIHLFCLL